MNSRPMILGDQVQPTSCGRTAVQNVARAFWQSRMSRNGKVAPLPQLTDLEALARSLAR